MSTLKEFREAKKSLNKKPLAKGNKDTKLNVAHKVDPDTGDGAPDFKVVKTDKERAKIIKEEADIKWPTPAAVQKNIMKLWEKYRMASRPGTGIWMRKFPPRTVRGEKQPAQVVFDIAVGNDLIDNHNVVNDFASTVPYSWGFRPIEVNVSASVYGMPSGSRIK